MPSPRLIPYPDQRSTFQTVSHHALTDLPLAYIERVQTSPGVNTSPLPYHILGVHLGAAVTIRHQRDASERTHHFLPGDVIVTPAGGPIHYAHAAPVDAVYVAVQPSALAQLAEQTDLSLTDARLLDAWGQPDPVLAQIGQALLREVTAPGLGGRLYIEALTLQLGIHLLRHYSAGPVQPTLRPSGAARLQRALDFIHAHYHEDLSLQQIAATVHLTPYHFSRVFRRAYGVTPYQYVLRKRVEAAHQLVQHTALTVAEIALHVGFADHSHLTRHYKRLLGRPPRG